jgi:hypothetical protein
VAIRASKKSFNHSLLNDRQTANHAGAFAKAGRLTGTERERRKFEEVISKSFFAELKRRNVYKVAVAYAVVAWLLIQAASIFFPLSTRRHG